MNSKFIVVFRDILRLGDTPEKALCRKYDPDKSVKIVRCVYKTTHYRQFIVWDNIFCRMGPNVQMCDTLFRMLLT